MDFICIDTPLVEKSGGQKEFWGPTWCGDGHHHLYSCLLVYFSQCTGTDRQATHTRSHFLGSISPSGSDVGKFCFGLCSITHKCLCLQVPVPACADPVALPLGIFGTTVRLTCTLIRGSSVGSYYINWFQKKPRSPPQYLLYYYLDSDKH